MTNESTRQEIGVVKNSEEYMQEYGKIEEKINETITRFGIRKDNMVSEYDVSKFILNCEYIERVVKLPTNDNSESRKLLMDEFLIRYRKNYNDHHINMKNLDTDMNNELMILYMEIDRIVKPL